MSAGSSGRMDPKDGRALPLEKMHASTSTTRQLQEPGNMQLENLQQALVRWATAPTTLLALQEKQKALLSETCLACLLQGFGVPTRGVGSAWVSKSLVAGPVTIARRWSHSGTLFFHFWLSL